MKTKCGDIIFYSHWSLLSNPHSDMGNLEYKIREEQNQPTSIKVSFFMDAAVFLFI